MRVTKTIREYIEKQVRMKIEHKYEAEKNEAQRIRDLKSDFETRAARAARQAALVVLEEAKNYTDIFDYDEHWAADMYLSGLGRILSLKDCVYKNSVHKWSNRMRDEINEKVQDVVVTLELGGNKADLDRMLLEL